MEVDECGGVEQASLSYAYVSRYAQQNNIDWKCNSCTVACNLCLANYSLMLRCAKQK